MFIFWFFIILFIFLVLSWAIWQSMLKDTGTQAKVSWIPLIIGLSVTTPGFFLEYQGTNGLLSVISNEQSIWQMDTWGIIYLGGLFLLTGWLCIFAGFNPVGSASSYRPFFYQDNGLPDPDGLSGIDNNRTLILRQTKSWRTFLVLLYLSIGCIGYSAFSIYNANFTVNNDDLRFTVFSDDGSGFVMAFFALVFIIITIWVGMTMLNPKVTLMLYDLPLTVGSAIKLQWRIDNPARTTKITRFYIKLIGQERATYRRGTDTTRDTHDFYSEVYDIALNELPNGQGLVQLQIPEKTMHTWSSKNNSIIWQIQIKGKLAHRVSIDKKYEIAVFPTHAV